MPSFELRLVDDRYGRLLQGRCGGKRDWGGVCSNTFDRSGAGSVACRELGLSEYATSVGAVPVDRVEAPYAPSYNLFVDIGCVGNEASLTECEHYSLRTCRAYVTLECFTGKFIKRNSLLYSRFFRLL